MHITEFTKKICGAVEKELGDGYRVELKEIMKNNGHQLKALLIISADNNLIPTIYLDSFHEAYEDGMPLSDIVRKILEIYRKETPKGKYDMAFFKNYEMIKDRICFRLVNAEDNRELLEEIPHVRFLDLAICFFYVYSNDAIGDGIIRIYNSHMDMWRVTTEELLQRAMRNTPKLYPADLRSMQSVLEEMLDTTEIPSLEPVLSLSVLTNTKKLQGAGCILYPKLLQDYTEKQGKNCFIIPSSIHEVIIIDDNGYETPGDIKEMIREVNNNHVAREEILSYNLYYFDRTVQEISICEFADDAADKMSMSVSLLSEISVQ